MDHKRGLAILFVLALALPSLSACAQSTPAAPAVSTVVALNPPPTTVPQIDTPTVILPTATPVLPTTTHAPTDTPTVVPATITSTALPATDTPTALPPTATPVPPIATRVPAAATVNPVATSPSSTALAYSLGTRPITPLTDAMFKLLGRTGITLCVLDSYPADLTFSFPGQESQTGVIGTNYQDVRVWTPAIGRQMFSSPFTIPSNGMMCILWQPGPYTWRASIPNVGQAQGDVTISSGQTFVLTFRP